MNEFPVTFNIPEGMSAEDIVAHVSSASEGLRAHVGSLAERVVLVCRGQDLSDIQEAVSSMSGVQVVPYGDLGVVEIRGDCTPMDRDFAELVVHEIANAMRVMSEASASFAAACADIERQPSEANRMKRLTKRVNKKGKRK